MEEARGIQVYGGKMKKVSNRFIRSITARAVLSVRKYSGHDHWKQIRIARDTRVCTYGCHLKLILMSRSISEVRAQVIYTAQGEKPDHLLVYLFANGVHKVNFVKVWLDDTLRSHDHRKQLQTRR